MEFPSVHIITLNWNGLLDTLECVASLTALTYPNVRIHVVDNASKDKQAEAIEKKFPAVDVIKESENRGFCGGNNVGIEKALADGANFVMLLNNDALVPLDLIEKLLAEYDGLENVGAVSPVILQYPETEKIWFSNAQWQMKEAKFRLSAPGDDYEVLKNESPFLTDFTCGCCLFTSAATLKKVGLLDERYFAFFDEAEWCARLKKHGLSSYVIPAAHIFHKVSKSTPSLVSTYLMSRNRLLWMKENLSYVERLKSAPYLAKELAWHLAHLAGVKLKSAGMYTKNHSRALVQGWKDYSLGRFGKWSAKTEKIIFPS